MASPSPVPPERAVTNGSNSRSRISSLTPAPLSVTHSNNLSCCRKASTTMRPPTGVFWIAFRMRLSRARCIWNGSKRGSGLLGSGVPASSDKPVEFLLASTRKFWKVDRSAFALAQRFLQHRDLPRPREQHAREPDRRAEDGQGEHEQPGQQLRVSRPLRGEGACHGPGCGAL